MSLRLYLFGAPRVEQDELSLHIGRRKEMALAAYLALHPHPHTRERLASLLYPEAENALAYLRRDLSELRQQLGDDVLTVEREVSLKGSGDDLWVDVLAFRAHLACVAVHGHFPEQPCAECLNALTAAVELYTDDFLAGFTLPDCPDFDEWQFFEVLALQQSLAEALLKLIEWHAGQQEYHEALKFGRRWLALDPLHEPAHRRLMELFTASGQRSAALRQYQECVRLLHEELGVDPASETTSLFEAIRADRVTPTASTSPPATPPAVRHSLPPPITTFVGRDQEMAALTQMLTGDGARLLTLLGPGGIGKTRLAVETARKLDFPDGVWFVPLAPLSTALSLPGAIGDALNLRLHTEDRPLQALLNQIQHRELLLILDNFEHLLPHGGADFVSGLLQGAPRVRLLITSRERLALTAEWVFPVAGLSFPDAQEADDPGAFGAVRLFMDRARQVRGDFALRAETRVAVSRICRLTEGMPLALELAATWSATLSITEIAAEIQRSLDFLTTTLRDLPDRHRSMRAVFDSSWKLLDDDERDVFRQLSIFRGGFTRAAAESVCLPSSPILPVLASLVAKSLLKRSASGRYEVHELMRQYGAARLMQDPKVEEATRDRHCRYYLSFCASQEARLKGPDQLTALEEMSAELANLRLAWEYAARHSHSRRLLQSAEAIWLFLQQTSHSNFQEQARLYDRAVGRLEQRVASADSATEKDELALGKLLALSGSMYMRMGDFERALARSHESLARLRRLGATREIAFTLNMHAAIAHLKGKYEAERSYLEESLAGAQEAGDRWLSGYSLNDLAMVIHLLGDPGKAQQLAQESSTLFRQLGDSRGLGYALDNLGLFAFHLGAYADAEHHYREGLAIRRAKGDLYGVATALSRLGAIAHARGDGLAAREHLLQALQAAGEAGAASRLLDILVQLAALLWEEGETTQARRILHCCLSHPSLSDAARTQAEALAESWPERAGASPSPEVPASLDALVGVLLADTGR